MSTFTCYTKCSINSIGLKSCSTLLVRQQIEFFTVWTKLAEMATLYSKDLTTAKKKVTSSGAQPGTKDYCWFRSPMPNHMS